MPAQWTAELISKMHAHRITQLALAQKLGYTPQYVSTVLNNKCLNLDMTGGVM